MAIERADNTGCLTMIVLVSLYPIGVAFASEHWVVGTILVLMLGGLVWAVTAQQRVENAAVDAAPEVRAAVEARVRAVGIRHLAHLLRERRRCTDKYGGLDQENWSMEMDRFLLSVVRKELPVELLSAFEQLWGAFSPDSLNRTIERVILELVDSEIRKSEQEPAASSPDPLEFEVECARRVERAGWSARRTGATGDQGADIVASRMDHGLVIQCKMQERPVGNSAVQEVISARIFWRARHAAVVSISGFTRSAAELAGSADVLLLHADDIRRLPELIGCGCTVQKPS